MKVKHSLPPEPRLVAQNRLSSTEPSQPSPATTADSAQPREKIAEALHERILAIRHAEAKRAFAPNILGGISAVIAAAIGFTRQKHADILGVIRNLRGDGRLTQMLNGGSSGSRYGNEPLRDLVDAYNAHEAQYSVMRGDTRKNLGVWLHETYENLKHRDVISTNEILARKLESYHKTSTETWENAQEKVKELGADLAKVTDADKREHLNWKIERAYEKAYIKITSARQQFRNAVDEEVLISIRRLGKRIGFRDLTREGQLRSIGMAATVGIAVGAVVNWTLRFITKESAQERQERQELQATKLWELSRKQDPGADVAMVQELNTQLSNGRLQDLVQQSAPQSYVERVGQKPDAPLLQASR